MRVLLQHSLCVQNLLRASTAYMRQVKQNDTGRYCMELQHDESNPHPEISVPPCLHARLSIQLTLLCSFLL
jgi:hypothetical protein